MGESESHPSHGAALIFSAKAAVSAVVAIVLFNATGWTGDIWAAVSAVIVTQPAMHPSVRASLMRITANVIGAAVGALASIALGHQLLSVAVGVLVTGMICHFTKLDDALRAAYAAVIIVIMSHDSGRWYGSMDRVVAVILGCVCAVLVGIVFDKAATLLKLEDKKGADAGEGNE